uniref:Uncharacterized protein n=1 Tax=Cacopsylla melanoneura TaxID=428564 RepID=A0A8D8M490_9HEMI
MPLTSSGVTLAGHLNGFYPFLYPRFAFYSVLFAQLYTSSYSKFKVPCQSNITLAGHLNGSARSWCCSKALVLHAILFDLLTYIFRAFDGKDIFFVILPSFLVPNN